MTQAHRVGLIVPSSNTTMETELPELLGRHADARFTFHSSRAQLHTVDPESLQAMVAQVERCAAEIGGVFLPISASSSCFDRSESCIERSFARTSTKV